MTRKNVLLVCVVITILSGVLLSMTPFIESLKPNAKAIAALPRISLSNISPGEFIILDHPAYGAMYNGYKWSILIYRRYDGIFKVWDIPTKGQYVGLPDLHWWRPVFACLEFGPTKISGKVDESLPIKCHDTETNDNQWYMKWEWDINGVTLSGGIDSLNITKGIVEGGYFVFAKRS